MNCRLRLLVVALTLISLVTSYASGAENLKPEGKKDAAELIDDAGKALAFTIKSARAAGKELDASNPDAKPFLGSLKKISVALEAAKKDLAAKDKGFFKAINDAKAGIEEMQVTWNLAKSKNADVIAGGKKLSGAVTALEEHYDPLSERKAKGGELTEDEKANFEKLKSEQADLLAKIKDLSAKAKGDAALEAGLKELRKKVHEIEKAKDTVDGYVDAVDSVADVVGLVEGYSYYLPAADRTEWTSVESDADSMTSEYSYDDDSYDWSYTTTEVDVYGDYSCDITEEEETSEDSYVDDTSFELTESESEEVSTESEEISEEEVDSSEMESADQEESDQEDSSEMDSGGDDDGGGD